MSPGFTELDEGADALLRKQSWRDFLTASKADPVVGELLDAGIKPKDLDRAFEIVCLYEDVEFPPGDAERPDTAAGFKALDKFWAAMSRKLPTTIAEDTTCKTQRVARGFTDRCASRTRAATDRALSLSCWRRGNPNRKIVQKWWTDDAAAKKKIAAEVTALHTDVPDRCNRAISRGLAPVHLQAGHHACSRRRVCTPAASAGAATLSITVTCLQLAARVLRGNAEVRRALQGKYRWLFVDEFQDTDPVQAEIIFLLAGEHPGPAGSPVNAAEPVDWRSIPLRPGGLFVVGDPKQSIYRFRRADVDIYNVVRDRLTDPHSGQVLSLTTNFRSRACLCDWANDVFRHQFPSEPTAYSPKFAPLDAHRAKNSRRR